MEMIDPFKSIFALLFFLGGCVGFQPPPPVLIDTPEVTNTTRMPVAKNTGVLEMELIAAGRIDVTYTGPYPNAAGKLLNHGVPPQRLQNPGVEQVEKIIQEAIDAAGGVEKLQVNIRNKNSSTEDFQNILKALRTKQITRIELTTTPEK